MHDALDQNPEVSRRALAAEHEACFAWAMLLMDHDRHGAEDVLQQAYLLVLSGRARFGGASSLRTWLFGVVRNVARRSQRRQRLDRALGLRLAAFAAADGAAEGTARAVESAEDAALWRAVRRLPARQRELLGLVFYGDMSVEQAAGVLGIGVGSARTHYHRAKQSLRRSLEASP